MGFVQLPERSRQSRIRRQKGLPGRALRNGPIVFGVVSAYGRSCLCARYSEDSPSSPTCTSARPPIRRRNHRGKTSDTVCTWLVRSWPRREHIPLSSALSSRQPPIVGSDLTCLARATAHSLVPNFCVSPSPDAHHHHRILPQHLTRSHPEYHRALFLGRVPRLDALLLLITTRPRVCTCRPFIARIPVLDTPNDRRPSIDSRRPLSWSRLH